MIRQRRRHQEEAIDPSALSFGEAYRLEVDGAWPSWRERRAFWSRSDVPAHLRDDAEPDPRVLLGTRPDVRAYTREWEQWLGERLEWLQGVAHG